MRLPSLLLIGALAALSLTAISAEARFRRFGWYGPGYYQPSYSSYSYYDPCCAMGGYGSSYASPGYAMDCGSPMTYPAAGYSSVSSDTYQASYTSSYAPPSYGSSSCESSSYGSPSYATPRQGPQLYVPQGDEYASAPQPAANFTIAAYDNYFEPKTLNIPPGTVVQFVNKGEHAHTVTARDGSWDSGDIQPGATYSARFQYAGSYDINCRHHTKDKMEATITVGEAPRSALGTRTAPRY
jgi:plastocyanin